jgi:hypothetical protein
MWVFSVTKNGVVPSMQSNSSSVFNLILKVDAFIGCPYHVWNVLLDDNTLATQGERIN